MRTTINIQDRLFDMLMADTKAKSKTQAVEIAIREYLKMKKIEDLIDLSGKIDIDPDWQRQEADEIDESRRYC